MTLRRIRTGSFLPFMLMSAAALMLWACETTDRAFDERYLQLPDIVDGEPVAWPFRPVEMRIHPLTRVAAMDNGNETHLEVRVEFRDVDGHTTRGLGELIVALHTGPAGPMIDSWRADLTDLTVNAQRFDDVSRTYLLRLRVDPADLPARPELRATYHAADGRTLSAEHRLGNR